MRSWSCGRAAREATSSSCEYILAIAGCLRFYEFWEVLGDGWAEVS